jgi:hypothetical protein
MRGARIRRIRMMPVLAVAAIGIALSGCADGSESSESSGDPAATLEETKAPDGTELHEVTLTRSAIKRLGIDFAPVSDEGGALVVPYAAVVYDPEGGTWVFVQPGPRSFLRERVIVREIKGDQAFLLDGPEPGTQVVTVATPELYGAEQEIGA